MPDRPNVRESLVAALEAYFAELGDQEASGLYKLVMSDVEPVLLKYVLDRTGNNQSRTASILGLNRGTLRTKLHRYGLG